MDSRGAMEHVLRKELVRVVPQVAPARAEGDTVGGAREAKGVDGTVGKAKGGVAKAGEAKSENEKVADAKGDSEYRADAKGNGTKSLQVGVAGAGSKDGYSKEM